MEEVIVNQKRIHPIFGRLIVRYICKNIAFVEFEDGTGHTYFLDIIKTYRLVAPPKPVGP